MEGLVSIITVNYNGWQDTCELIASLKKHETYPYEVIVVDNASSGKDVEQIRTAHPDVCLVCSERNLGFAGGNNLGFRYAKGEYLFFLNNDTVIKAPVLEKLVRHLRDGKAGGVSPMLRAYTPPYGVQYHGYLKLSPITLRHTTPPYDIAHPEIDEVNREIEVMHGAAMMLSRKAIEEVGEMAECYFLYFEEFDWSYRLLDKGCHVWYEPTAVVYHKEGTKRGRLMSSFREYYLTRSRVLFARRSLKGWRLWLSCLYLTTVVMGRDVLRSLFLGKWRSVAVTFTGTFAGLLAKKNEPYNNRRNNGKEE